MAECASTKGREAREWINGAAVDGRHGTRSRLRRPPDQRAKNEPHAMLAAIARARAAQNSSSDDSQPLHTRLEDMPPAALAAAAAFSAASAASAASAMDDSLAPPDHSMLDETADGARTR